MRHAGQLAQAIDQHLRRLAQARAGAFEQRHALGVERAAQAGFEAVEFMFPYAHSPQEIKARLDATGLKAVLHNLPAGDWAAGERGIAALPGREDEARAAIIRLAN